MSFKNWLDKLKVAHVGASQNQDNPEHGIWADEDAHRNYEVYSWLEQNDPEMAEPYKNGDHDFIDLNDERDFLRENKPYNVIILHFLWSPPVPRGEDYDTFIPKSGYGYTRLSPYHNRKNWITRLAGTGAKYIFAWGGGDEVSGEYLREIPGYDGPNWTDKSWGPSIYKKIGN
jgi:hypothetical protein